MKQEALTVNLMTSILCFEMALRHWMFYLPLEQISTEMGVNQPNLGVWLIPVTASLGMFYYFGRNPPDLSFYQIIRICFIGMIPMVIAFIRGGFENIFAYTIYDPTSRPSFLILLPIALSVLVSQLSNHRIRILILLICVVMLLIKDNFILHYFTIYLAFSSFSQKFHTHISVSNIRVIFVAMSYPISVCILYFFESERINIFIELVASIGFLYTAFIVARFGREIHILKFLPSYGMLNFYISQAVIFTVIKSWIDPSGQFNSIFLIPPAVCFMAVFLSSKISIVSKPIQRVLADFYQLLAVNKSK